MAWVHTFPENKWQLKSSWAVTCPHLPPPSSGCASTCRELVHIKEMMQIVFFQRKCFSFFFKTMFQSLPSEVGCSVYKLCQSLLMITQKELSWEHQTSHRQKTRCLHKDRHTWRRVSVIEYEMSKIKGVCSFKLVKGTFIYIWWCSPFFIGRKGNNIIPNCMQFFEFCENCSICKIRILTRNPKIKSVLIFSAISLHVFQPSSQQWQWCFSWPHQDKLQRRLQLLTCQTHLWPHSSTTVSVFSGVRFLCFYHWFSQRLWSPKSSKNYIFLSCEHKLLTQDLQLIFCKKNLSLGAQLCHSIINWLINTSNDKWLTAEWVPCPATRGQK